MATAAVLLATGTMLGAAASHGLESRLDAAALNSLQTGVDYQLLHALGILALAMYGDRQAPGKLFTNAVLVLIAGILLFCAGVYSSALGGPYVINLLAPVGGIGLMAGWLLAAVALFRRPSG